MATLLRLPAVAAGAETARLSRWLKGEGDPVAAGEPVAEVESDKATVEIEATATGRLGRILVQAGEEAAIDAPLALLLAEGEEEGEVDARPPSVSDPVRVAPVRLLASPLARRIARETRVALAGVTGSGPNGRIMRRDVEAAVRRDGATGSPAVPAAVSLAASPVAPPAVAEPPSSEALPDLPPDLPVERVPHSAMRRTIARRLSASKRSVPHFYLTVDCAMDPLLALRRQINEGRPAAERISINDFIVRAAAVALHRVPDCNAIWTEEAMLRLGRADVAVAVATDGGLITPVVRDAARKPLSVISAEIAGLAARARGGGLAPADYRGGSITVSNLGMYGIREFAAILNPPQAAILAVGATTKRLALCDGVPVESESLACTLSVDHRAIDGAVAARWLGAFRGLIESPLQLLA